jgi:hypothetical protein
MLSIDFPSIKDEHLTLKFFLFISQTYQIIHNSCSNPLSILIYCSYIYSEPCTIWLHFLFYSLAVWSCLAKLPSTNYEKSIHPNLTDTLYCSISFFIFSFCQSSWPIVAHEILIQAELERAVSYVAMVSILPS